MARVYLRLTFKVFHDIEKPVVDVWVIRELHFDLVEVGEGIFDVERAKSLTSSNGWR